MYSLLNKCLIYFIALILFFSQIKEQSFAQVYFAKRLSIYEPSTYNFSYSVLEENDGYSVIGLAGDSNNYNWRRIGIININKYGNKLWTKIVGSNQETYNCGYPGSTKMLSDSSFYFAGFKGINSTQYYQRGMIIKFNANWEVLWIKDFGDNHSSIDTSLTFYQLDISSNKSIIITGYVYHFGNYSYPILMKIDSNGNEVWTKWISPVSNVINEGRSVSCTSDGGYIIGSYKYSVGNPESADPILYKTDSLGNIEWTKNLGGPYMDYYPTVDLAPDGNIIVATCYADSMSGNYNAYRRINIIKLDNNGNTIWNKKYGKSSKGNYLNNIQITYDGHFLTNGHVYTSANPERKGWLFKIKSYGDSIWYREYYLLDGKDSENIIVDTKSTNDKGIITCGYVIPFPPDTGQQDIWVMKLDSVGCDTPGCDPTVNIRKHFIDNNFNNNLVVFPNPAYKQINFILDEEQTGFLSQYNDCRTSTPQKVKFFVYNILGTIVEVVEVPAGYGEVSIDVSGYVPGVYLVVARTEGSVIGMAKFLKQ